MQNTPQDALPESFRVELVNPERYQVIAAEFPNGKNGVDQVRDQGDFLDRLFSLLNGVRNATIAVAVVQALAALLLISNTIQLAAFNRRNETNIMRLVGASRWYTQLPFILEAALAGLVGGLLAVGGLVLAKVLFVDRTLAGPIKSGIIAGIDWSQVITTGAGDHRGRRRSWPRSPPTSRCACTSGCRPVAAPLARGRIGATDRAASGPRSRLPGAGNLVSCRGNRGGSSSPRTRRRGTTTRSSTPTRWAWCSPAPR